MRWPFVLAVLTLLGACTAGPDFKAPAPPPPQVGYESDGAGRAMLGEGPADGWWNAFGSPELDTLVARAMASNHSLEAARATLERARERVAAVAGRRLPQIDANARAEYRRLNLTAFGLDDSSATFGRRTTREFDLYSVGGGVSYDLDLFGRNRRALEQAAAEAEAQDHAGQAAHLVIAGRVVAQVLAIAALNDRIAAERALLTEDERNVGLTEIRRRAGAGTQLEVLSAQSQLAEDRASLPEQEQALAEARTMLAILVGVSPAELGATDFSLGTMTLPGEVPVALPSALVRKRPDILEAEARLHAATAAVGVATAQLYPNITLGASTARQVLEPTEIFGLGNPSFDLFGGLTAPIFHGGTLRAEQRAAEAEARAAAASYRQVVVEAFGQVSALLSALETDGRAVTAQRESADVAARTLHLSRRSFEVGNSGILQVLDASRSYQRTQLALVEARSRQFVNVARLYVATASGWTPPAGDTP